MKPEAAAGRLSVAKGKWDDGGGIDVGGHDPVGGRRASIACGRLVRLAGAAAAALLFAIGLLQLAWGLGLAWPWPSEEALAEAMGFEVLPPPWLTVALALLIAAAGAVVLGRMGSWGRSLPRWVFGVGIWALTGVLLLRAATGFVFSGLALLAEPTTAARFDVAVFSPLSLLLGLLCLFVAARCRPERAGDR